MADAPSTPSKVHNRLHELTVLCLEEAIEPQQVQELNRILQTDQAYRDYYLALISFHVNLDQTADTLDVRSEAQDASVFQEAVKKDLEDTSIRHFIELTPGDEQPDHQEPDRSPVVRPVFGHRELWKSLMNAAAIILIALTVVKLDQVLWRSVARHDPQLPLATLVDQVGELKEVDAESAYVNGADLYAHTLYTLNRNEVVEAVFLNGAQVSIEGPATFSLMDGETVFLEEGRAYVSVPKGTQGFTLESHEARVIDLGTEFGLEVDHEGNSQIYTYDGLVSVMAIREGNTVSQDFVEAGQARRLPRNSTEIREIAFEENRFIRRIDSQAELVWRGESVNLADIVSGGDGIGRGEHNRGVDINSGRFTRHLASITAVEGRAGLRSVPDSAYIDCVFVPGVDVNASPIASDGSMTMTFPATSGMLWGYVFNGAFHQGSPKPARHALVLDGIVYGDIDQPAITMHSNSGITFDLHRIRQRYVGLHLKAFQSLIGISDTVEEHLERRIAEESIVELPERMIRNVESRAEFWVLLDGQVSCRQVISSRERAAEVNVSLSAGQRYLTLAVTEADDDMYFDWALFARPKLVLEK